MAKKHEKQPKLSFPDANVRSFDQSTPNLGLILIGVRARPDCFFMKIGPLSTEALKRHDKNIFYLVITTYKG